MKVLFILGKFPSISETFIVNQINGIINNGVKAEIYAYEKGSYFDHSSLKENQLLGKTYYHKVYPIGRKKRLKDFCIWLLRNILRVNFKPLFQILKRKELYRKESFFKLFYEARWFLLNDRYRNFDIVHAHFGHNGERVANLFDLGVFKNSKLIVTFHGFDLIPEVAANIQLKYTKIFRTYSALTVNTMYLLGLINRSVADSSNIHVLPVGLDTSFFKRERTINHNGTFKILFCGRLIPLKAPDRAILILEKLIEDGYSNCELVIVGDGRMKGQIARLIKDKKLDQKVICMGPLNQLEIKSKMSECSVLIMPGIQDPETGRAETQGLVIQEAQSMNLPVIVSDVGGMKYGLLKNESGFVIAGGDIEKFVKKIEYLILNPEIRKKMGKSGRSFVEKKYDSRKLANDLIEIYGYNNLHKKS